MIALIIAGAFLLLRESKVWRGQIATNRQVTINRNTENSASSTISQTTILDKIVGFIPPIDNWESRVTKKPFGIYITPGDSPVSPERFAGHHTGTDFETFPNEQEKDVAIQAICNGPLLSKKTASGYGGIAVQQCVFQGETVSVVYGHVRLSSVTINVNETLHAGDTIGALGRGYSSETDGERKHLHLGIHKGEGINILGYVQKSEELNSWIDVSEYL